MWPWGRTYQRTRSNATRRLIAAPRSGITRSRHGRPILHSRTPLANPDAPRARRLDNQSPSQPSSRGSPGHGLHVPQVLHFPAPTLPFTNATMHCLPRAQQVFGYAVQMPARANWFRVGHGNLWRTFMWRRAPGPLLKTNAFGLACTQARYGASFPLRKVVHMTFPYARSAPASASSSAEWQPAAR